MQQRQSQCPKCQQEMEEGFIPDRSYGAILVGSWLEGAPEKGWTGARPVVPHLRDERLADLRWRRRTGGNEDRIGKRRRPNRGSTSVTSSPACASARPSGFTTVSIAPADRPRTSSSCTSPSSPPTAPAAARRSPTKSASFSTPPPIGSSSPCATPSRSRTIWPRPSSPLSGSSFSKSQPVSSRRPAASVSPSRQLVPRLICSAALPTP
jgi:hypothetical protein